MKTTLSFEFANLEAAQEFLAAVNGRDKAEIVITTDEPKKERKARSDAGQPRGPYKKREDSPAEAAAPATQTPAATPPAAPAAAPAALTLADVRAAMTGRSTEKNIGLLKKFGYAKSSDLPQEKYADFIAAAKRGE